VWKLKAAITCLLIVATANSGVVLAQSAKQNMNTCIVAVIDGSASNNLVVSAQKIIAMCACITNRQAQGLNPADCPRHSAITAQQMREKFYGDW